MRRKPWGSPPHTSGGIFLIHCSIIKFELYCVEVFYLILNFPHGLHDYTFLFLYIVHMICTRSVNSTSVSRALESLHTILHSGGRGLMLLITADERRGAAAAQACPHLVVLPCE